MNDIIKTNNINIANKIKESEIIKNNDINNNIKKTIKGILEEKDIKMKLFEEFEQILSSKYTLTKNAKNENFLKDKNNNNNKSINNEFNIDENEYKNKIKQLEEEIYKKLEELNKKLDNIKIYLEQFQNNIINNKNKTLIKILYDEINLLKKNNNNYITVKVNIKKEEIGKDIVFLRQKVVFKYICNFERDDIEIFIDGENVPIKYKNINKDEDDEDNLQENFNLCSGIWTTVQNNEDNIEKDCIYYWNFSNEGKHTIKIIFRKHYLIVVICFMDVKI